MHPDICNGITQGTLLPSHFLLNILAICTALSFTRYMYCIVFHSLYVLHCHSLGICTALSFTRYIYCIIIQSTCITNCVIVVSGTLRYT